MYSNSILRISVRTFAWSKSHSSFCIIVRISSEFTSSFRSKFVTTSIGPILFVSHTLQMRVLERYSPWNLLYRRCNLNRSSRSPEKLVIVLHKISVWFRVIVAHQTLFPFSWCNLNFTGTHLWEEKKLFVRNWSIFSSCSKRFCLGCRKTTLRHCNEKEWSTMKVYRVWNTTHNATAVTEGMLSVRVYWAIC